MLQIIISSLNNWHTTKNERQKLQDSYIVLSVIVVLTAGIIALSTPASAMTRLVLRYSVLQYSSRMLLLGTCYNHHFSIN